MINYGGLEGSRDFPRCFTNQISGITKFSNSHFSTDMRVYFCPYDHGFRSEVINDCKIFVESSNFRGYVTLNLISFIHSKNS